MSGGLHILVADSPEGAGRDLSVELAEFPKGASVRRHAWNGDEQGLIEAASGADAILTDYVRITPGVIRELENCRLISIAATGYDAVDIAAAHAATAAAGIPADGITVRLFDHLDAAVLVGARAVRTHDLRRHLHPLLDRQAKEALPGPPQCRRRP